MFTIHERTAIRDELISFAHAHPNVVGAALVGSAARDAEDRWSDIDLVLQLSADADEPTVVQQWTEHITTHFGVADTLDVFAGDVRYRVLLLTSSLQIDVSFWPYDQFRATQPYFRLLFGDPAPTSDPPTRRGEIDELIGLAWLYALHARSATARGRTWQAVIMLDDLRDQIVALMCRRHGLEPWHGRGVDLLPDEELELLLRARASDLQPESLDRSRGLLLDALLAEVGHIDSSRADRLQPAFAELQIPSPQTGGVES